MPVFGQNDPMGHKFEDVDPAGAYVPALAAEALALDDPAGQYDPAPQGPLVEVNPVEPQYKPDGQTIPADMRVNGQSAPSGQGTAAGDPCGQM